MSSALVRQALEFVDPEESGGKRNKRPKRQPTRPGASGQGVYNHSKRKEKSVQKETRRDKAEEIIEKLLALSTPSVDKKIAEQILKRSIKGKPLADKLEIKKDDGKSILFPD
ncbi:unnamed protein product [Diatraea saccharalis]|uniref:Uncharacterized protein n=1 Tax=Diatraea saccharalis TaxID=40085 RepID=A0A9N9WF22_9NEOP|nr:unnamed protein product [Diatraea saccharalis]